jgi:hypothetical protein
MLPGPPGKLLEEGNQQREEVAETKAPLGATGLRG